MQDYEKLGVFYLGRLYDLERKQPREELFLYDSKDLLTHAVCVGMTGSGKTGLCIGLIEEAAIDGIPAIVIDPKGDLSNLLLTFPELRPEDFRPYINEAEAREKGMDPEAYARGEAARWKEGLAQWAQTPERIARLKQAAEFAVYTPASRAGRPVSILRSFAAPGAAVIDDREAMRERVGGTAASLLSMIGLEDAGAQSREHILLSTILDRAWREGTDLSIADIVQQIQNPPVARFGVMDLDSFYPAKERFALAMSLNNLLASPGFEAWMEGEPLDVGGMLYTAQGKPRVAIFSIAHLSDSERMFFVSLLLSQTISWMRTQPGTTSLRALLYMDEIFGYFPPVANPPSKGPLLTLLKQARAFGLGVVLATQNPVDLDYKGLSNAGTWFVGRLQTERDIARLLDGLEGAASAAGTKFDRAAMARLVAGLGSRVFLVNNVHEDAPELFQTRWTLSYLRGPLTREQLRALGPVPAAAAPAPAPQRASAAAVAPVSARPVLPPDVPQLFAPASGAGRGIVYSPALYGAAEIHFLDDKAGVDEVREVAFVTPISEEAIPVDWEQASPAGLDPSGLEPQPEDGAAFAEPPPAAAKPRNYAAWTRDFTNWLFRTQRIELFMSPSTGLRSRPGESERDFRIHVRQAAREERDRAAEKLRARYAPKIAALEDRLRRARQAVDREREQAEQQRLGTALSAGATLLGAFLGRKTFGAGTLGRASTTARSYGRMSKEARDVERATETATAIESQLDDLNRQFEDEVRELQFAAEAPEDLRSTEIRPKKANISVKLVSLLWVPEPVTPPDAAAPRRES